MLEELHTSYRYVVNDLQKTTSLESAVFGFGVEAEAPGGTTPSFLPGDVGRLARAREALSGEPNVPSVTNGVARRVLKSTYPAMNGDDVKEVVTKLNLWGITPPVSGNVYESDLIDAIKVFQDANALFVDGEVGPNTWAKLDLIKIPVA